MRRFGKQPFAWNEKNVVESNLTLESSHSNDFTDDRAQQHDNITITKETAIQTCRNSVQGRRLIADDQGTLSKKTLYLHLGNLQATAFNPNRIYLILMS